MRIVREFVDADAVDADGSLRRRNRWIEGDPEVIPTVIGIRLDENDLVFGRTNDLIHDIWRELHRAHTIDPRLEAGVVDGFHRHLPSRREIIGGNNVVGVADEDPSILVEDFPTEKDEALLAVEAALVGKGVILPPTFSIFNFHRDVLGARNRKRNPVAQFELNVVSVLGQLVAAAAGHKIDVLVSVEELVVVTAAALKLDPPPIGQGDLDGISRIDGDVELL